MPVFFNAEHAEDAEGNRDNREPIDQERRALVVAAPKNHPAHRSRMRRACAWNMASAPRQSRAPMDGVFRMNAWAQTKVCDISLTGFPTTEFLPWLAPFKPDARTRLKINLRYVAPPEAGSGRWLARAREQTSRPVVATTYNRLWEPSQKGGVPVCLQAHHAMLPPSLISTFCGVSPVPSWPPSQKGWFCERPQAHHQ